jgi:hypothetical protein
MEESGSRGTPLGRRGGTYWEIGVISSSRAKFSIDSRCA